MERRFNLRLWVVAVALGATIVVHAVLSFVLTGYIADQIIARDGQLAQEFLDSVLRAEDTGGILLSPEGADALASFSHHLVSIPGLLRANIYGPDRVIRWSTDADLVGSVPEEFDDLDESLNGTISASLNDAIGDSLEAKETGVGRVIEVYVPVHDRDGNVVAVVEFYRDATSLRAVLRHVNVIIWLGALIAGLLIIAALYAAALRAARRIADQTAELQHLSVMASLGQMSAAVTHSLRNPLASIRSSVELLQLSRPGVADDFVADVTSEIDRIDRQVQDLLHFAGPGGGDVVPVPLADLVETATGRIAARAARSGVAIQVAPIDPGLVVEAVPALVFQVLENIYTNGIEALPGGGTIRVEAWRAEADVCLAIHDDGPGFPPHMSGRAPKPFETTKVSGLGLGLAISGRLLSRFGGRLELANGSDGGAVVSLRLPAARIDRASAA